MHSAELKDMIPQLIERADSLILFPLTQPNLPSILHLLHDLEVSRWWMVDQANLAQSDSNLALNERQRAVIRRAARGGGNPAARARWVPIVLLLLNYLVSSSLDGSNDVQVAIDLVQTFFAIPNKPNSLSPFPHRGWTTQDHPMLYLLRNSWEFMLNVFNPETDLPPNEVSEEVIAKMTRDWIDQVKKYLVPFDQVWSELEAQTNPSSVKQVQQHQHIVPPPTPAPSGYFKNPREESVAQDSCSKRRKLNGTRRKEAEDEEEFDELEELAPESENKKPGGIEAREKVSTLFMAHQNPPLVEDSVPLSSQPTRLSTVIPYPPPSPKTISRIKHRLAQEAERNRNRLLALAKPVPKSKPKVAPVPSPPLTQSTITTSEESDARPVEVLKTKTRGKSLNSNAQPKTVPPPQVSRRQIPLAPSPSSFSEPTPYQIPRPKLPSSNETNHSSGPEPTTTETDNTSSLEQATTSSNEQSTSLSVTAPALIQHLSSSSALHAPFTQAPLTQDISASSSSFPDPTQLPQPQTQQQSQEEESSLECILQVERRREAFRMSIRITEIDQKASDSLEDEEGLEGIMREMEKSD